MLASCGLPYHLIDLDSLEALGRDRPSPSIWQDWGHTSGYEQIYLYVNDESTSSDAYLCSRMFSTEGGAREDPATGSATAALAGHLVAGVPHPGPVASADSSGRRDWPAQPDHRRGTI